MITPSDLLYFQEVAKSRNVSRAAERLGITQPALSHCLARLERELKTPLFIRSKKGVELTSAGQIFFERGARLKDLWDEVLQDVVAEIEEPRGLIRLGCHPAVAEYSLPTFFPRLIYDFPKIKVQLNHGLSRHMTEEVIRSKLDVAIAVNPVKHPDLVIKELAKDYVTLWRAKKCLNPNVLVAEPSLIQSQDILRNLKKKKFVFENQMETSSLEVVATLLKSGAATAILPARVVKALAPEAEEVPNAPIFHDRICLVFKPEFRKTKRGALFVERVIEGFRNS